MRGTVGQMQVPQRDHVSKKALHRVLDAFNTCWWYLFWPFFTALLLVVGVSPARADAAGSVSVPGAGWVSTGMSVTAGDVLTITASGQWVEGSTTSGPDGQAAAWTDNFFNVYDLGVCNYCAVTRTSLQAALIAYIGEKPPAPGSYTSQNIYPEALKIFLIGSQFSWPVSISGQIWLAKNADAYSAYTVDNQGAVTANVRTQTINPASAQFFQFQQTELCFRNALSAAPGEATAVALLSTECADAIGKSMEGIALYYCLEQNHSADICLLGSGIPLFPSGKTTTGTSTHSVPANYWLNSGVNVVAGDTLTITASGQWMDGAFSSGPDGAERLWPDNFLNISELGACNTCAKIFYSGWGELIGYIGVNPPPADSYISRNVLPEAMKVFGMGSAMQDVAPLSGRLWLGKNADAYSGYIIDNSGSVTATTDAKPGGASSSLPFDGAGLCFRNLLNSRQNDAAAAQAVLSRDCVMMKTYLLRVALDYCLLRFNSAKACLLAPPGIPIIRN